MYIRRSGQGDKSSGNLFDSAGTDALSADGDAPHLTVDSSPYFLEVGSPNSLAFIVSVADVVSYGSPLTAD